MATGYTRQHAGDIYNGATISATHLNDEFNQMDAAMDEATGHNHDGTVGGGAPLKPSSITGVSGTGLLARTGASTAVARTITGTASQITVTNGDGASGNPTISIATTAVTPGTYANPSITVDAYGRITAASAGTTTPTGMIAPYFAVTAPTGWVRANGRTIGSASSGASERANADCETLFTLLWNNASDTICPVSGGRGANAAADWAANKTITLPDMRGRAPFGTDQMGAGSAASRITNTTATPDGTTVGASGGVQTHALTTSEIPSHSHDVQVSTTTSATGLNATVLLNTGTGITLATNAAGGSAAHTNMPPFMLATMIIKL